MPGAWRKDLTLRVNFDPLVDLHLLKVLLRVSVLQFLLAATYSANRELLLSLIQIHEAELLGRVRPHRTVTILDTCRLDRALTLLGNCLPRDWLFDPGTIEVVPFHSVEASKYEKPLVIEHHSLVKSARGWRDVEGDSPCPRLRLKIVLVNIIETFEGQVDSAKDVHGVASGTGCVPIPPLDVTMHVSRR